MTNLEIQAKIEELFKNEEFCVKFYDSIDDLSAIKTLLDENGVVSTEEDVKHFVDSIKARIASEEKGELSEEDMDEVSGGLVGWVVAGAVSAAFFGYQTYKNRKALNSTFGYCK